MCCRPDGVGRDEGERRLMRGAADCKRWWPSTRFVLRVASRPRRLVPPPRPAPPQRHRIHESPVLAHYDHAHTHDVLHIVPPCLALAFPRPFACAELPQQRRSSCFSRPAHAESTSRAAVWLQAFLADHRSADLLYTRPSASGPCQCTTARLARILIMSSLSSVVQASLRKRLTREDGVHYL